MTADTNTAKLLASDFPTKSVTIFQSSVAEVTREFTVSLQVRLFELRRPEDPCATTDQTDAAGWQKRH